MYKKSSLTLPVVVTSLAAVAVAVVGLALAGAFSSGDTPPARAQASDAITTPGPAAAAGPAPSSEQIASAPMMEATRRTDSTGGPATDTGTPETTPVPTPLPTTESARRSEPEPASTGQDASEDGPSEAAPSMQNVPKTVTETRLAELPQAATAPAAIVPDPDFEQALGSAAFSIGGWKTDLQPPQCPVRRDTRRRPSTGRNSTYRQSQVHDPRRCR